MCGCIIIVLYVHRICMSMIAFFEFRWRRQEKRLVLCSIIQALPKCLFVGIDPPSRHFVRAFHGCMVSTGTTIKAPLFSCEFAIFVHVHTFTGMWTFFPMMAFFMA